MRNEVYIHIIEAQRKAEKLLEANFSSIANPPVEVIKIAQGLGYNVFKTKFKKEWISGGVKFYSTSRDNKQGEIHVSQLPATKVASLENLKMLQFA